MLLLLIMFENSMSIILERMICFCSCLRAIHPRYVSNYIPQGVYMQIQPGTDIAWVPAYESIDAKSRMTNRMRDYIRQQALRETFSRIKTELDISVPTIKSVFSDYVATLDSKRLSSEV